jgi:hypothetical protein
MTSERCPEQKREPGEFGAHQCRFPATTPPHNVHACYCQTTWRTKQP